MIRHRRMKMLLARRNRLTTEEEACVASHLEHCAECQELAHEYAAQVVLLRSLRREAPSPGLRQGLMTEIERRARGSEALGGRQYQKGARRWARPSGMVARATSAPLRSSRWLALLLAPALALTLVIVGVSIDQPGQRTASAAALLQAAAHARLTTPYSSTAVSRYQASDTILLPQWQTPHLERVRAAVRDTRHYRIEATVVEPALDSGTLTTLQNGAVTLQYDTRTETAGRRVVREPASYMSLPIAGGGIWGPDPLFNPAQSIQQYLNFISSNPGLRHVQHYARIAGQAHLLGRAVTEVAFAPVQIGTKCVGSAPAKQRCNVPDDSGSAQVWIDDTTHLILKYAIDLANSTFFPGRYAYQVTALQFGRKATRPNLSSRLPVHVGTPESSSNTVTGSGTVYPNVASVPAGFLQPTLPAGIAYASTDMNYLRTPPLNRITGIDIEFARQKAHSSVSPAYHHYVLVQERIRVHGLPTALMTGRQARAGVCTVWTGKTAGGLRTIAFARNAVSVLTTTDTLSSHQLISYVAHSFCRSGSSTR